MSPLRQALTRYLLMRRGFGYRYENEEKSLHNCVAYMEAAQATVITRKLAMAWIIQAERTLRPNRLSAVRGFARHLSNIEQRTETLPVGVFPSPKRRRPYIYTEAGIARLLDATLCWGWLRASTAGPFHCLFGLLAAPSMRLGKAIGLGRTDIDLQAGVLTLCETKGGMDRLVPLHSTTTLALADYATCRDDYRACRMSHVACRTSPCFFVLRGGQRLRPQYPEQVFVEVVRRIGLRYSKRHSLGLRLHDPRHSFAVNTIQRCYRAGKDVERLLPTLTTYLGHSKIRDTYWYLSACPELMGEAASRLETRWETAS